ncbi:MAG: hypothetical protein KDB84_03420 [Flavobacteriales bacterium]|nr:hypothetical protein [Flavobacteriales bacterium]
MPFLAHLLFLCAVIWCLFWLYAATNRWFALGAVVLSAVHWLAAVTGIYSDATSVPPPQLALLAPVVVLLVALLLTHNGRAWMAGLPLFALTAIHVLRVPVELVLHDAYEAGLVPQDMTYSGHNFDILSGISAVLLLVWMRRGSPGRGVLIAWNLCCLVLLAIIVITAVLSLPSGIQRMNFEQPNVLVTTTPWVLLPALLVPAVLFAHVAALYQLVWSSSRIEHSLGAERPPMH